MTKNIHTNSDLKTPYKELGTAKLSLASKHILLWGRAWHYSGEGPDIVVKAVIRDTNTLTVVQEYFLVKCERCLKVSDSLKKIQLGVKADFDKQLLKHETVKKLNRRTNGDLEYCFLNDCVCAFFKLCTHCQIICESLSFPLVVNSLTYKTA